MKANDIDKLIEIGATDRVRKYLKKLSIPQRLNALNSCIPIIKKTGKSLRFFKENFSVEVGAILMAEGDLTVAEDMYRSAKTKKKYII